MRTPHEAAQATDGLHVEVVAVVLGVNGRQPVVLASGTPPRLPSGPLTGEHESLQRTVRSFVRQQTGHSLGFIEQLYTFADPGRGSGSGRTVSIGYLGLTRGTSGAARWTPIYDLLPWEDRRHIVPDGEPDRLTQEIEAAVLRWARSGGTSSARRQDRCGYVFGLDDHPWRPELALQRYELLWEAGLVTESPRSGRTVALTGRGMLHDHRRIVATGLSRIRSTLQYRPVVFELMPDEFTLGALQETVEALAGQLLHKQNFRRLVEQQHELVEPTGGATRATGGRPARLYRFRPSVFTDREQLGTKLPLPRAR